MSIHASTTAVLRVALMTTLATPFLAASGPGAGQADGTQAAHQHAAASAPASLVRSVRLATLPFFNVEAATAAGYAEFLGCVSGPQEGAMGVHYVNGPYVADGEIDVAHPEALLYERSNGRLRLLGVEFIVDAATWLERHPEPPVLEGQAFQFVSSPNRFNLPAFFELHVWAWRDNPNGAFVDWNPKVSCEG